MARYIEDGHGSDVDCFEAAVDPCDVLDGYELAEYREAVGRRAAYAVARGFDVWEDEFGEEAGW